MGRKPCCNKEEVTKGAWTTEEDRLLKEYISANGEGKWRSMPLSAGLKRCGKSCRLRWFNYLKPGTKRGNITLEEEDIIIELHKKFGNRWSLIASRLPARTDNEIKNYWNTTIKRKLLKDGSKLDILPKSKKPVRRVPTVKAESNIITPKKSPDSEIAVSNDSSSAKETSSLTSFWERLLRHLELGVITVDEMWSGGEPSSTTFSKDTGEKRSVNTSDSFGCNIDEVWDQNVDISAFTSNDQCEWFKWIDSSEVESISSVLNEDPE